VSEEAAVPQEAFIDTQPGAGESTAESGEAQGERTGRRRRRGRGGRDRDEAAPVNADGNEPISTADAAEQGAEAAPSGDGTSPDEATSEAGGEGRRRGRGGRGRDRRERSPEVVALEGIAPADAQLPTEAVVLGAEEPAFGAAPLEVATEAPVVPVAVPQPAPIVVAPPKPAVVEAFVLPMESLQAVAHSAGLEWVNSDAEKIRAVQAAMAAEPQPVHVPRERKPLQLVDEGPLVLVETRKDLSQIKLPFEIAQGASQQPPPSP